MHGLEAHRSAALKPAGPESCQKAPLSLPFSSKNAAAGIDWTCVGAKLASVPVNASVFKDVCVWDHAGVCYLLT